MPYLTVNGVNTYYETAGQGETIAMVHGYTGSSQDWASQIPFLAEKYRVLAPDLRGHGRSAAPAQEEAYTMPIFAADVYGLLTQLGVRKCCLMGHSMGGFTALEFALAHQEMLAALVLVDTSSGQFARAPGFPELRRKLDELARIQGLNAAFEYDAANNPARIDRFTRHPEQKEISRQKVLRMSVDGYIYAGKAMSKWRPLTSRLSEIKVPTLLFWGNEDAPFYDAIMTMRNGVAGAQMVTVNGCGHSPHEEAPAVFNQALAKFLSGVKW